MQYLHFPSTILYCYGLFLIVCGIASVSLIGMKAKTALASGGLSGTICIVIAWLSTNVSMEARWAGLFVTLALFVVFSWRSAKTLFKIFELIPAAHPDLKGKGIAFLIISLMAVVSIFAFLLQIILFSL